MLDGFAAKHSPRVLVLLVTTDENPEIASTLPSNSHPTFVLLRGGKTVKVETGARTVPELEAVFAHHLR